ncbi:MAG: hypothetical protein K2O78_03840 [Muribaculaceae bacterium]|nr:hypothetical protein [Muribaculaceae bacterium]
MAQIETYMTYQHLPYIHNHCLRKVPKVATLLIGALVLLLSPGCKPTEKNYRSAYDVAREKRERDLQRQQELQNELGLQGAGVMQQGDDGAMLEEVAGRKVWTRHMNFAKADTVRIYAVSVATFGMGTNARAMAADLRNEGWSKSRAVEGGGRSLVLIGDSNLPEEAVEMLTRFEDGHKDWQYVGQPGIMLVIGGSR